MTKKASRYIAIALLLGVAGLLLYAPLVRANTNYFYHEDDAHHFNRTIEMAQRRDLNPHYFNKPALHFYLRLPVVYAAVGYERLRGRMTSVKDIRTRDPYGLAGYAYTPSHPQVLIATRVVSVVWSCLLSILTFLILCTLSAPLWTATAAALLVAISPEVVRNSYVIGVDTLMALMCLSTTACALWSLPRFSYLRLTVCALLAGLACAAKYNAAPICIVPLSLWWLRDRSRRGALTVAFMPLVGFLLGAPFSLLSFKEFWTGMSYEAWHYAVAGHEGNSAERGWPQALFYLRWLISDGIGMWAAILLPFGVYGLYRRNRSALFIVASFPIAYVCLMLLQKTHFTRNMLAVVPYAAIGVGLAVQALGSLITQARYSLVVMLLVFGAALSPVWRSTVSILSQVQHATDSRDRVLEWLSQRPSQGQPDLEDIAIAGSLQLPIKTFALPGVDAFDPSKSSLAQLLQSGYTYIIVPTDLAMLDAQLAEIIQSIPGNPTPQRVPKNPAISILRVKELGLSIAASRFPSSVQFTSEDEKLLPQCASFTKESHCWITSRVTQLQVPKLTTTHSFEIMSPWPNQLVTLTDGSGTLRASLKLKLPWTWESLPVSPRQSTENTSLILTIGRVHSPLSQGLNSDSRRLGIAVR